MRLRSKILSHGTIGSSIRGFGLTISILTVWYLHPIFGLTAPSPESLANLKTPDLLEVFLSCARPLVIASLLVISCQRSKRSFLVNSIGAKHLQSLAAILVLLNTIHVALAIAAVVAALTSLALIHSEIYLALAIASAVTLEFWIHTRHISLTIKRGLNMKFGSRKIPLK